jgi:hypothetical protein
VWQAHAGVQNIRVPPYRVVPRVQDEDGARLMLLVAIDPGVSTGLAIKSDDMYVTSTITDYSELWDMLKSKPDKVAFETFKTAGMVNQYMLHTIELVGSIRGICYAYGIPHYGQTPAARIAFKNEAETLMEELSDGSHTVHELDALMHLLLLEYRIKENKL